MEVTLLNDDMLLGNISSRGPSYHPSNLALPSGHKLSKYQASLDYMLEFPKVLRVSSRSYWRSVSLLYSLRLLMFNNIQIQIAKESVRIF